MLVKKHLHDRHEMTLTFAFETAYGKIINEKGVGACAYYSPVKTEEEKEEEEKLKAEKVGLSRNIT